MRILTINFNLSQDDNRSEKQDFEDIIEKTPTNIPFDEKLVIDDQISLTSNVQKLRSDDKNEENMSLKATKSEPSDSSTQIDVISNEFLKVNNYKN